MAVVNIVACAVGRKLPRQSLAAALATSEPTTRNMPTQASYAPSSEAVLILQKCQTPTVRWVFVELQCVRADDLMTQLLKQLLSALLNSKTGQRLSEIEELALDCL